ncbi:hypothetical protein FPRO05_14227 [Fusarium proliferatum]|uniref:ATP-dependent bile acid permease n=1 Tax=Gibberella intermedia TaxID=948311 RepID=A0A365MTC0_GIBIN|nr:hypothetical protein FPRO05_14227 [Fusarium proliferatum]
MLGRLFVRPVFEVASDEMVISRIAIPIRQQLCSAIYTKVMRSDTHAGGGDGTRKLYKEDGPRKEEELLATGSRQNVNNLAGVDAKRVGDAAAYAYTTTSVISKFVVACMFLSFLLGWESTVAGLTASLIIVPFSIQTGKQFAKSQTVLMSYRDQRNTTINEVLRGIREIKFQGREDFWHTRISKIRRMELKVQWTCFLCDVKMIMIFMFGPVALAVVSLGTYFALNAKLSPSIAFTAIAAFGSLEMSFANLPEMIASMAEAYISLKRIESFLERENFKPATLPSDTSYIVFENATIAYPNHKDILQKHPFVMRELSFSFPPNALSVIIGASGSGKSLVLSAIAGECQILSGNVRVPQQSSHADANPDEQLTLDTWVVKGKIGFVPKDPWIENTTIMNNILFGLPLVEDRYRQCLSDCHLLADIAAFPQRDRTSIGARGIRLSGGQKWRIALARALYSRADILLLNDIFSAVDVHTAHYLCDKALMGTLSQGRTRILVTHHPALCTLHADYFINLGGLTVQSNNHPVTPKGQAISTLPGSNHTPTNSVDNMVATPTRTLQSIPEESILSLEKTVGGSNEGKMEVTLTGAVKLAVYQKYFEAGGTKWFWVTTLAAYIGFVCLNMARPWWIKSWVRSESGTNKSLLHDNMNPAKQQYHQADPEHITGDLAFYLSVYVAISILACLNSSVRFYLVLSGSIRASRGLFEGLLYSVLRAPTQWLDSVPVGQITNRFTVDMAWVDAKLGYDIAALFHRLLQIIGIASTGLFVSPATLMFSLIPILGALYYAPKYLSAAREMKRLESASISLVLEHFRSSLAGLSTIRAFSNVSTYTSHMHTLLDHNSQASWHLWLFNRWFNFRINLTGTLYCVLTAALVVLLPNITAPMAGFVLSFTLDYPAAILWTVRQYANVELSMNSAERVMEYKNMVVEAQDGVEPPQQWPSRGELEVKNLSVGYGSCPSILKNITFTIPAGQSVGVVGRTGAGKSTLILALFRLLAAREGSIMIDGMDISKLKVFHLRSRLQIIPQDLFLFSGTVRSNLDLEGLYPDSELQETLNRFKLLGALGLVKDGPCDNDNYASLSTTISEGGSNLSAGQRQLLCICRVFLSRPKLLILDEATSGIDKRSDMVIQQLIQQEAARCGTTLVVVAHRLSSVINFNAIMVLESGTMAEFGPPKKLMDIKGGIFRSLVEGSSDYNALKESLSV